MTWPLADSIYTDSSPSAPAKLKVLADVHMYPPFHNAGAEWMLHAILRDLAEKGHECRATVPVMPPRNGGSWAPVSRFQGVGIHLNPTPSVRGQLYGWADIVLTHLDRTPEVQRLAESHRIPVGHLIHNHQQVTAVVRGPDLCIYNSEHLLATERRQHAFRRVPHAIVVRPPVTGTDYAAIDGPHDCVTILNLSDAKGGPIVFSIAKQMPHVKFLGVLGAYDHQTLPPEGLPPNFSLHANDPDVKKVYARTKVLLVPSNYESYGRVAAEACASGIPTIASPTEGLIECLGHAGIYAHRESPSRWIAEIERLLTDTGWYNERQAAAFARSQFLDARTVTDLARVPEILADVVQKNNRHSPLTGPSVAGLPELR